MRTTAALAAAIALISHSAVADIKRHESIPQSLQGSWSTTADSCGPDDKSLIVLAAKAYSSAESKCSVEWVSETAGPHGPIYSAYLRCAGEPAQPPSMINLIIRPDDAKQISVGLHFSSLKVHQKCAAKP